MIMMTIITPELGFIISFDDLAGPVKKMAIPQHGQQNKLTKLYN